MREDPEGSISIAGRSEATMVPRCFRCRRLPARELPRDRSAPSVFTIQASEKKCAARGTASRNSRPPEDLSVDLARSARPLHVVLSTPDINGPSQPIRLIIGHASRHFRIITHTHSATGEKERE